MTTDPGPRMLAAVAWVARHPGCSKAEAGRGSGASYDSIQRAIIRGLVYEAQNRQSGRYELYTDGQEVTE